MPETHGEIDPLRRLMPGDGPAARLMRATDWARTPLGPPAAWPVSLKTMVSVLLGSRQPMFLFWGPALIQFYNDAYIPSFGVGKHPAAMGQSGADCWQEIWPIIGPQIDTVMRGEGSTWHEDHLVPIERNGHLEDVYWTYGYSPVQGDDGAVAGTFVVCTETTRRVVGERRMGVSRAVADAVAGTNSVDEITRRAAEAVASGPDVPAAWLGRLDAAQVVWMAARGAADAALGNAAARIAEALDAAPRDRDALERGDTVGLSGAVDMAAADNGVPVRDAYLVPLQAAPPGAGPHAAPGVGVIAFGLNPRIPFDAGHRHWLHGLAASIAMATARAEEIRRNLAADAERDALLMKSSLGTATLVGRDMVFRHVSTAYSRIVGRTDLIGKTYAEAFPELADTELPGILQRVYATGQRYVSPETLVRLAAAGTSTLKDHHFEFSLEPMRDAAGRVQGLLAVAADVTAQVQARQFLERSSDERQALLVAAESASRAKDEFLALLGHELRNPLSPIVTALQVLKSRPHEGSQREFDIISRQVTHLTRLVDDLLDISTITRGKVQLRRTRSSVADIVARSVEMASHAIEQRRHTLDVAQPDAGLAWVGDAARLVQVVSNLLTNAARYSPEGARIELNVAAMADAQLVISVRDEGNGIAADVLPQVFGMFFQGQHNIDRAEGGLGLGLALVKKLVEMHDGTVSAESAGLGRGSTFTVRLPLHGAEPDAASALSLPLPLPVEALAAGRRVMVVDDNHDAADTLAELLRLFGHTVAVAREPLAALELAEQFDPDVAILDIGLPGIDGYELAERLRRQAGGRGRRLIALTGYGQASDRSRSRAAGFDLHLVKPVDFDALHAALMADAAPR